MARIRLGVNNCFAVKRWPLPSEWASMLSSMGVRLVQFSYDLMDPRIPEPLLTLMVGEIKEAAESSGITIHSAFTGLAAYSFNLLGHPDPLIRADGFDWHAKAIKVASKLGAEACGGHIAALSVNDWSNDDRRREMISAIVEGVVSLSYVAREVGLKTILWEPMPVPREPPSTISEARSILERVNSAAKVPVRLCIDLGHACSWRVESSTDLDPYAWLRELGRFSPAVHVQQTDGKADRHWPFTEEYNRVGIIKPDKVVEALDDSGASDVVLFLEIIHPFEAPDDKVLREIGESVKYWRDYVPE